MPNTSWDDIKRELDQAWNVAHHGNVPVHRAGTAETLPDSELIPNTGSGRTHSSYRDVEAELREVFNMYQNKLITLEDFEQEKNRILKEI